MMAALLAVPATAWAQPQALHDKAWYLAHTAERIATTRWCEADESRQMLFACRNAEDASSLALVHPPGGDFLASPDWWARNAFAREHELEICSRPNSLGAKYFLRYCGAAAAGSTDGVVR